MWCGAARGRASPVSVGGRPRRVQHGRRLHVRGLLRPSRGARGHRSRHRVARQRTDERQLHDRVRRLATGAGAQPATALPCRRRPGAQGMNRQPDADVLVIGSGAAGAAICSRLAGRGAKVVCLEQGDWVDRARLPKSHPDWEVRGRRYWAANPNGRRWPADYPVSSEGQDPIDVYMYNAVGGSQIGFAGNYWRMAPSDFRVHSLDGVGADWPFDYEELAPYYTLHEAEVGVAGLAGDPCRPPREPLPNPPAPIGRPGQLLVDAYEKLGWYWWPTEQAITTHAYRGRPACDNRGWCTFGCPQGSLSTADLTYWPGALKNGVELRTQARVREVVIGGGGKGTGARHYEQDGVGRGGRAAVTGGPRGGLRPPRLFPCSRPPPPPHRLAQSGRVAPTHPMG